MVAPPPLRRLSYHDKFARFCRAGTAVERMGGGYWGGGGGTSRVDPRELGRDGGPDIKGDAFMGTQGDGWSSGGSTGSRGELRFR